MKITILIDNPKSWFVPFGKELLSNLIKSGYKTKLVHELSEIEVGDCLFLLSCEKLVGADVLSLNEHNIVIHASKLPEGRGFSPLTWNILEGKNEIYISLLDASEKADEGDIYIQDSIIYEGHELLDELQEALGKKIVQMAEKFISELPNIEGVKQHGVPSWYNKRKPKDSELDPNKTIAEQFNLLRVVDNDRYPAFFMYKSKKYYLRINKHEDE